MDARGPRHHDPLADDPLWGSDGTAPPPPTSVDPTSGPARPSDLRLPPATDAEGVAAWMDADRERGLQCWEPEVRDVPPPRPIPTQQTRRTLPPETTDAVPVTGSAAGGESSWRRERREEAEFRAQFGEWRADRVRPASRGVLGGVRLGAPLLVLVAVLIVVAALALHL
jgi:hypothetical protein